MKNQAVNINAEPKDLALRPVSFTLRHSYCFKGLHHLIPKYCKCLLIHWFSTLNIWNDRNTVVGSVFFFFFFDSFYFLLLILISQSQKFWSIDLRWLLSMKNCQISPRDSNMQFRATGTFGSLWRVVLPSTYSQFWGKQWFQTQTWVCHSPT